MNSTHTEKPKKQKPAGTNWLDTIRINRTVRAWRRDQKKEARLNRFAAVLETMPYAELVGEALYRIGFGVEYTAVRTVRTIRRVCRGIGVNAARLLLAVLRPFLLGIITLLEDLTAPFVQLASGMRHMRELSEQGGSPKQLRAMRRSYLKRGVQQYFPLVLNALSYILPVAAAFGLVAVVRTALGSQYILNVQVNGESVGFVATEQVFENAREDVQSRINTAKEILAESGTEVPDTQWDIQPTYTLAISGTTMTESQTADAILRASSDEIVNGTAVYVDGELRYVTTEGDHLRTFLESIKKPYLEGQDTSMRVSFLHDIQLVDGVFLSGSITSYQDIISTLRSGDRILTYTAVEGETVQSAVDTTGVTFDSLAQMNPDLLTLEQEIPAGTELIIGAESPELLKVKVVHRQTYLEDIPFETITTESSDYDFGKTVVTQEGATGVQEVTQDLTYIDGSLSSVDIVKVNVLQSATPKLVTKGTKLKSGMVAQVGSGQFVWPVPQYKYVSRWMGNGHNGADICAAYGVPIIASDSGVVVTATYHWSYGNYVVIDHGNGWRTLYGHMSSIAVSTGQGVARGQVIGYIGSTGNSTGNHCHFEMYQNGVRVSARNFFGGL